ncbi:MAG: Transcriptional regulatory protein ZraR [Chlamydiae bacterium]|nr:Transcriptional regulatory protein ZraR [Chlamydiota bacterium]
MKKVLIIEREISERELLMKLLKAEALQLFSVEDGAGALELLQKRSFDLILSDLKGIQTLNRSNRRPLGTPLIHLCAKDDPVASEVDDVLNRPVEMKGLRRVLQRLKKAPPTIIAKSPQMKQILKQIEKIAQSHSNVFISGESGTGKEVVAGMIHELSKRKNHSFVRVNCAALSNTLIESEFFGHEKGAFTGAVQRRIGRFELADLGTLLLDEISEIPSDLQAKLLRVVQEQEFERVGGTQPLHVDVRLISTSNRNMKEAIASNHFREDLYYRLNVIPILLPPLRERREDILPLADHFLREVCHRNQIPIKTLSKGAKERLLNYSWPGNIRELRNIIEHGVVMDYSDQLEEEHLFFDSCDLKQRAISPQLITLKQLEKEHILLTLEHCQNNRTKASKMLGISVRTLRNKLKLYQ